MAHKRPMFRAEAREKILALENVVAVASVLLILAEGTLTEIPEKETTSTLGREAA